MKGLKKNIPAASKEEFMEQLTALLAGEGEKPSSFSPEENQDIPEESEAMMEMMGSILQLPLKEAASQHSPAASDLADGSFSKTFQTVDEGLLPLMEPLHHEEGTGQSNHLVEEKQPLEARPHLVEAGQTKKDALVKRTENHVQAKAVIEKGVAEMVPDASPKKMNADGDLSKTMQTGETISLPAELAEGEALSSFVQHLETEQTEETVPSVQQGRPLHTTERPDMLHRIKQLTNQTAEHSVDGDPVDSEANPSAKLNSVNGEGEGIQREPLMEEPSNSIVQLSDKVNVAETTVPEKMTMEKVPAEQFSQRLESLVLEAAQVTTDNKTIKTHLQLTPERLGEVDIQLELKDNQLVAKIIVEHADTKQWLEQQLTSFTHKLADNQITLQKFDVIVSQAAVSSHAFDSQGQSFSQQKPFSQPGKRTQRSIYQPTQEAEQAVSQETAPRGVSLLV